jgi:hypothetical protein
MSMDHRKAQSTNAAERYLLGEMSEPERFDFESHYFECEECAGDVRAVHALAKGVKEVCAEEPAPEPMPVRVHALPSTSSAPRGWWSTWLTPAFAAGLAVVAGYQGLVVIPGLRSQTGSHAMAPIVLRAAERGEDQVVEIQRDQPITLLSLDVNGVEPGTPLSYEITGSGSTRISNTTKAPPNASPLIVVLTNTDFSGPGSWTLFLRDPKGTEISRYPFTVQIK